jgi:hypothetical protein
LRVLESRCGPILASRCGSIFASAEARLQVDSGRRRNGYEDEVLECLKASLPDGVRATIIADRGFGDNDGTSGFDFIVRFRQDILLTEQFGDQRPASQWLHETGRARLLKDMAVTADYVLPTVVVHDKRMKEPWCLATNRSDPEGGRDRPALRHALHHRGDLSGHPRHQLRHGTESYAHWRLLAPRPALAAGCNGTRATLMAAYDETIREHEAFGEIFGV